MASIESADCRNTAADDEEEELTEEERSILQKFRMRVQDVLTPSHDNYFLLRFLRARKFNIERAEKMLRDHLKLRKDVGVDFLLRDFVLPEVIQKYLCFNNIGTDKEGHVIFGFLVGFCDFKGIAHSLTFFNQIRSAAYIIEKAMADMEDRHAQNGTQGRRFVVIFDLLGFDFRTVMSRFILKQHLQLLRMYEANYPETLEKVFVLNVPGIFHTWFSIAKRVIDEKTVRKIQFCQKGNAHNDLLEMIDPDVLPGFLGGQRTDPDGNPDCFSLFPRAGKIAKNQYLTPGNIALNPNKETCIEVTIPQRSFFNVVIEVKHSGSLLRWIFHTEGYNIRYGVYFVGEGEATDCQPNRKVMRANAKNWAIPLEAVDSHIAPTEWQIHCEESGIYIIHFDNTFSWMKPKQLKYKVDVLPPVNFIM